MKMPVRLQSISGSLDASEGGAGGRASVSRRKILLIDDEPSHLSLLRELLVDRYDVLTAEDGEEGMRMAGQRLPDLVLLDLRLPRASGLAVCLSLRQDPSTRDIPIIMMTGHDNQEARTTAFRMGADDYLCKPFSLDEVLARVESKIRRVEERRSEGRTTSQVGNLLVDHKKMEASVDGRVLELSALEFRLLEYFVKHCEEVLSREQILEDLWKGAVVTSRTIDTHVSFLRKKLERSRYGIRTLYGAGYILRPREEASGRGSNSSDSDERG